jgi:hypothetical protein
VCITTVSSRGTVWVDASARGEDFYLATSGDFYLATSGDHDLATRGDFFMATDRSWEVCQKHLGRFNPEDIAQSLQ